MTAPVFNYSKEYLSTVADEVIKEFETNIKKIIEIPSENRNFNNTVKAFENALSVFSDKVNIPIFLAYVSPDGEIRNIAQQVQLKITQYSVDIFTREDIFNAIKEYVENKKEDLDEVDNRLLNKIMFEFKQNGLYGDEKTRKKVKKLLKQLVELELKFQKNLREDKSYVELTEEELKGMDKSYIERLQKTPEGKYIVTTNYPDYIPFMDNAENDEARKKLEYVFNNRCYPENVELMEKAIKLRQKIAKLLGYKTFADYVLEDRMAKKSDNVINFLNTLYKKIRRKGKKELKELLKLKHERASTSENTLYNWEWKFYSNLLKKKKYEIDYEKIKEYFPLETVIKGMFEIFEKVFEVKFVESKLEKWDESVRTYEVKNGEGKTFAYFYFDLFPRDGKYKHAACFPLRKGKLLDNGEYQLPAAAIVSNFTPSSPNTPSLLSFDEVVTLFHEFGHVTHNIFTKSRYAKFAGTSVSRDFVEVPSEMLEKWAYYPEVLNKVSSHFKTGEVLPKNTVKKIIKSKNAVSGLFYLRQLFFAVLDITYHTKKGKVDTTKIYEKLMKKIFMIPMSSGTHPQASFGHLMGGYESGYYSYLWSEVIACDLFGEFKKAGILNPEIGRKYVELILSRGGSVDEEKQVKEFLNRDVSYNSFLEYIGIKVKEKVGG